MRAFLVAAVVLMVLGAFTPCAADGELYSAIVQGSVVDPPDSKSWTYEIQNTSSSANYTIWMFSLQIDESIEVLNVESPTGWMPNTETPGMVVWINWTSELASGGKATGFGAVFSEKPVEQTWSIMFNNIENPGESPVDYGYVNTVPEPSSIAALMLGLAGAAGMVRRQRK